MIRRGGDFPPRPFSQCRNRPADIRGPVPISFFCQILATPVARAASATALATAGPTRLSKAAGIM